MCGIAGILGSGGRDLRQETLARMRDAIRHRGPDDTGLEVLAEDGVAFAHVRLSILDLSTAGHQPMWNDSRSVMLVFNGEIFNFKEIRSELEARGKVFRTQCDTEVLVKGYEVWGRDLVHKLNGMFAFAVWDRTARSLWLVRDRLGVKPLYYFHDKDKRLFLFASEIKAILEHPSVGRKVDPEGLQSYLSMGYVVPPCTMFQGIRKLPAAHELSLEEGGQPRISRYWDLHGIASQRGIGRRQAEEEVRSLFESAVQRRLVSDVPVGAFLSGGVDSTLVVGAMGKLMKEPVRTFAAAFEVGSRSFKYNVDADHAEKVATYFGTRHTRLEIPLNSGLMESLRRLVVAMDEPHGNPTSLATLLLSERVRQEGISVAMSGDGSDEIFGGYPRYQEDIRLGWFQKIPAGLRNALPREAIAASPRLRRLSMALAKGDFPPLTAERLLTWWWVFDMNAQKGILAEDMLAPGNAAKEAMEDVLSRIRPRKGVGQLDAMMYSDLCLWIPEESNMRMDKTSMSVALETRAPFLDYKLIEYAMSIPFSDKAGLGSGKRLLKSAFRDILPKDVSRRPKWGWVAPVHHWTKSLLWDDAVKAVSELPGTGVFSEGVRDLVKDREAANPLQIWTLLVFSLWHKAFIEDGLSPSSKPEGSDLALHA